MLMVGLTGGIGAGKSAVAARLAEHGAVVIDADQLARAVVAPGTEGLAEVVAAFGAGVLDADGALDRPALGRLVFGDEEARRRLEAIIHPRVRARTAELAAVAAPDAIVVNDVPLLVETGIAAGYDLVIVVLASESVRIKRLERDRGMSEAQARERFAAQATDEQRRAVADIVLTNDGTLEELREQVDEVWYDKLLPATESY
jgi:dephospho-CoA kinase